MRQETDHPQRCDLNGATLVGIDFASTDLREAIFWRRISRRPPWCVHRLPGRTRVAQTSTGSKPTAPTSAVYRARLLLHQRRNAALYPANGKLVNADFTKAELGRAESTAATSPAPDSRSPTSPGPTSARRSSHAARLRERVPLPDPDRGARSLRGEGLGAVADRHGLRRRGHETAGRPHPHRPDWPCQFD